MNDEKLAQENARIEEVTKLAAENEELLESLEWMARQHCHTNRFSVFKDVPEANITDSGGLSADADALRLLARLGRFRIEREHGRMVVGYWPEHDPKKKEKNAQNQAKNHD